MNRKAHWSTGALAAWALLLLFAAGCAHTQIRTDNVQISVPPITIVGHPRHPGLGAYDDYDLFERADRAFVDRDWQQAELLYVKLLEEYPDSEVASMARYNLGLVMEETKRWSLALAVYAEFPNPPGRGVRLEEVRLRMGICLTRLARYAEARAKFEAILAQFGVPPLEANEARLRLGAACYYDGDPILAEFHLEAALAVADRNYERGVVYAREAYAEGSFILGEKAFQIFQGIELTGTEAELGRRLRAKADALVAARDYYAKAIRTYVPEWVVASLFRVGMGYELFYSAIMTAPEPEELSPAEREEYRRMLAAKVQPLLDKALLAYRRSLELANEWTVTGAWVEQTRQRYEALMAQPRSG